MSSLFIFWSISLRWISFFLLFSINFFHKKLFHSLFFFSEASLTLPCKGRILLRFLCDHLENPEQHPLVIMRYSNTHQSTNPLIATPLCDKLLLCMVMSCAVFGPRRSLYYLCRATDIAALRVEPRSQVILARLSLS